MSFIYEHKSRNAARDKSKVGIPTSNVKSPSTNTHSDRAKSEGNVREEIVEAKEILDFDIAKIGIFQPKLRVSQANDPYEKEADRIAEEITRKPISPNLVTPTGTTKGNGIINRKCPACEIKESEDDDDEKQLKISRKLLSTSSNFEVNDDGVANEINTIRSSSGSSLDADTREFMESRFGYDFSSIRIHTDERATRSASSLNSLAYTLGNNIVFAQGQYQPTTTEGRRLLAHELTHAVQQNTTLAGKVTSKEIIQRDLAIEPVVPTQPVVTLSRREMIGALAHNRTMHKSKTLIGVLRDVLGISKTPEEIDEDFVNAVVRFQAAHGMVQDGRIGRIIAVYLAEELEAEGLPATAKMLLKAHRLASEISVDACGCIAKFERAISFNEDIAQVYLDCKDDPSVTNGPEVTQCVKDEFAARGTPLTTAGTTSSTGVIRVEDTGTDPCDILLKSSTFAHEWSHFMHDRGLAERFGEGTAAFHSNREDKTDWAEDEARAHTLNVHHLRWMIERLKSICPTP